jgi:hypothetical protein
MSHSKFNKENYKKKVTDCISTIINNTNYVMKKSYIPELSSKEININYELIQAMSKDSDFALNSQTTIFPFKVCTRLISFLTEIPEYRVKDELSIMPDNCSNITLNVKSKKTLIMLLFLFYFSANIQYPKTYGKKNAQDNSPKMNLFYQYFKVILGIYIDQFGENKAYEQLIGDLNIFADGRFKDEIFDFLFRKNAQNKNERVQKIYSLYIPKTRIFHREPVSKSNYPFKIFGEQSINRPQNPVIERNNSVENNEPPFKRLPERHSILPAHHSILPARHSILPARHSMLFPQRQPTDIQVNDLPTQTQPVHQPNTKKVQYSTIHPNIYKELTGKNYPDNYIYRPYPNRRRKEPLRHNTIINPYISRPVLNPSPYISSIFNRVNPQLSQINLFRIREQEILDESRKLMPKPYKLKRKIPPQTESLDSLPTTASFDSLPTTASLDSLPTTASFDSLPQTASLDSLPTTASFDSLPQTASFDSLPQTASLDSLPTTASFDSLPQTASFESFPTNFLPLTESFDSMPATASFESMPQTASFESFPTNFLPLNESFDSMPTFSSFDSMPATASLDSLPTNYLPSNSLPQNVNKNKKNNKNAENWVDEILKNIPNS